MFRIEIIGDATVEKVPIDENFEQMTKNDEEGSWITIPVSSKHTGGWGPSDGVELTDYLHETFEIAGKTYSEDEDHLKKIFVGGFCQFVPHENYDKDTWQCKTIYFSETKPTEKDLEMLIDYTRGQWSDGWGEGFGQHPSKVLNSYNKLYDKGTECRDCFSVKQNILEEHLDKVLDFLKDKQNTESPVKPVKPELLGHPDCPSCQGTGKIINNKNVYYEVYASPDWGNEMIARVTDMNQKKALVTQISRKWKGEQ